MASGALIATLGGKMNEPAGLLPPTRSERAAHFGGVSVAAGKRAFVELPVGRLPTGAEVRIPVLVLNGRYDGPTVWVSAAIHGDELNGIEIVRRVVRNLNVRELRGTIHAVHVVNPFGVLHQSRYLPDRRDLNRSFPGSARGSLAARIAHLFMTEVVDRCAYGIDLHTGSNHRYNLPQLRGDMDDPETRRIARAFGAPVAIDAKVRDGSLRDASARRGVRALLYEGGEAMRFNPEAIDVGERGVLRVFGALGMIADPPPPRETPSPIVRSTTWVRANTSGFAQLTVSAGQDVARGDVIAVISDVFDRDRRSIRARSGGKVIGVTTNPLVNRGDALAHIAVMEDGPEAQEYA